MFKKIVVSSSLFALAAAQSGAWGQCGGIGWTGATTCVSGYTCTYSNPYYSQCLPGTASTTKSTTTAAPPPTSTPVPTKTTSTTSSTAAGITPTSAAPLTGATQCAQAGAHYTLCQNLWGASAGVGSQTSTLLGTAANAVSWSTNWNWQNGPNSVKSYANIISNTAKGIQLSALKTAPTSWSWTYQSASSGIRADVSYDIWTGAASSGNPASSASNYEIMIWLSGEGGIQPVGQAIQTGISIGGYTWTLWSGPNQGWNVFSFVSANGNINNFNADLKGFFDFLVQNHGVSSSQYIQAIQTGTEPFTGSANLIINSYSVSIS